VNNDWLDIDILEDYLDGKLDNDAMHRIEKQALEDPFVAQALAGLSESPRRVSQSVSILQKQLYERIAEQEAVKKDSVFTWQRLSVAAAAAVMFTSVSIFFFMRQNVKQEQAAKNRPKSVEVNLAPLPAVIDSAKDGNYAAIAPAVAGKPVEAGQINPKRDAAIKSAVRNPRTAGALDQKVATVMDTTVKSSPVATMASARVASVMPAVSSPVGGWANFDTYITDNNKLGKGAKTGKFVELSFSIDAEGTPSDIKIITGIDEETNAEAVRLLKDGPKWELPKTADSRINYAISF